MSKKTISLFLVFLLLTTLLCACTNVNTPTEQNKPNESGNSNISTDITESSPSDKVAVNILKETDEKITETFEEDGLGKITFIHSTTSSINSLRKMEIAIGDIIIVDDFQYVFMKKYNETTTEDYDTCGLSVKAINELETYKPIYSALFGIEVVNADYCFYNNKLLKKMPTLPSSILSAAHCFDGCENMGIENAEISLHEIEKLSYADYMFANCANISSIFSMPLELESANGMFINCIKLEQCATISGKLLNANNMFENCKLLTGTLAFESAPKEYKDIFKGTEKTIVIDGTIDEKMIENYDNVTNQEVIL